MNNLYSDCGKHNLDAKDGPTQKHIEIQIILESFDYPNEYLSLESGVVIVPFYIIYLPQ